MTEFTRSPAPEEDGTDWRTRESSVAPGTVPTREQRLSNEWFWEHYEHAANEIIAFLHGDGLSLTGREVADVGCGDGSIDLGLVHKAQPASLVGFDVRLQTDGLLERARRVGVADELPANLSFQQSKPKRLPAADDSFDFVVTWSTFEHVRNPPAVLREVHRVLRPTGLLMLQLWPFYYSQHGSHLWQWFPEGFVQLLRSRKKIEQAVRANPGPDPDWAEEMLTVDFGSLNKITLDDLQKALRDADFIISKVELMTHAFHIPPELQKYPLSHLAVAGVKLLARP